MKLIFISIIFLSNYLVLAMEEEFRSISQLPPELMDHIFGFIKPLYQGQATTSPLIDSRNIWHSSNIKDMAVENVNSCRFGNFPFGMVVEHDHFYGTRMLVYEGYKKKKNLNWHKGLKGVRSLSMKDFVGKWYDGPNKNEKIILQGSEGNIQTEYCIVDLSASDLLRSNILNIDGNHIDITLHYTKNRIAILTEDCSKNRKLRLYKIDDNTFEKTHEQSLPSDRRIRKIRFITENTLLGLADSDSAIGQLVTLACHDNGSITDHLQHITSGSRPVFIKDFCIDNVNPEHCILYTNNERFVFINLKTTCIMPINKTIDYGNKHLYELSGVARTHPKLTKIFFNNGILGIQYSTMYHDEISYHFYMHNVDGLANYSDVFDKDTRRLFNNKNQKIIYLKFFLNEVIKFVPYQDLLSRIRLK